MKIAPNVKIENACSEDNWRLVISEPYLDTSVKDSPVVVATNGKIMAVVPVELEAEDVGGYVPWSSLAAYRKASKAKNTEAVLSLDSPTTARVSAKNGAGLQTIEYPRMPEKDIKFPDWKNIFAGKENGGGKPILATLKLDIGLLYKLSLALGSEDLILEIRGEKDMVKVKGQNGAYGAIMPVSE